MIPVFINVRNRLTTTRNLAEQVAKLPNAEPILIDNDSTWEPLLDWYKTCGFKVLFLRKNVGHHAPWLKVIPDNSRQFRAQYGSSLYVVTDCDLDISDCPQDVLQLLAEPLQWSPRIIKSGLSLKIDDLPVWQTEVKNWEANWWRKLADDRRFYVAAVDTTFAMYRCETPHRIATKVYRVPATRSAPPYCARHMPWYLDASALDEENQYYFSTSNNSNSWKPNGQALTSQYSR